MDAMNGDAEAKFNGYQTEAAESLTRDIEAFMHKDSVGIEDIGEGVKPAKKVDTGKPARKKGGAKDSPRSLKELLVVAVQRAGLVEKAGQQLTAAEVKASDAYDKWDGIKADIAKAEKKFQLPRSSRFPPNLDKIMKKEEKKKQAAGKHE